MNILSGFRPTWAQIDLGALSRNLQKLREYLGADIRILAVVKANAYGHGSVDVSRQLELGGVDAFGVAFVEEAVELRQAGIGRPILVLSGCFPGQERLAIEHDLTVVVSSLDILHGLDEAAADLNRHAYYQLELDTGMGRLGVSADAAVEFLNEARKLTNVRLDGVMSHFATAEEQDESFSNLQAERFGQALADIKKAGFDVPVSHIANSAGTVHRSDSHHNMVRLGLVLYGIKSGSRDSAVITQPVMSLKTRISFLKTVPPGTPISYGRTFVTETESVIATLPIGYADGMHRRRSNKGRVLVRGESVPIVGSVTMDATLIDVTNVSGVLVGDEVVIMGSQGDEQIAAEEIAADMDTIPYVVVCAVGKRVPRIPVK